MIQHCHVLYVYTNERDEYNRFEFVDMTESEWDGACHISPSCVSLPFECNLCLSPSNTIVRYQF